MFKTALIYIAPIIIINIKPMKEIKKKHAEIITIFGNILITYNCHFIFFV